MSLHVLRERLTPEDRARLVDQGIVSEAEARLMGEGFTLPHATASDVVEALLENTPGPVVREATRAEVRRELEEVVLELERRQ